MRLSNVLLLVSLLCGVFGICVVKAGEPHTLTLQSIHEHQQAVGRVVRGDGGTIYFERIRPLNDAAQYLTYESRPERLRASSVVMTVDAEVDSPRPLFPQGREAGYTLAGTDAVSPGGRYVGVLRHAGQTVDVGVYDTQTQRVRFFEDINVFPVRPSFSFAWKSGTEFLVLTVNDEDIDEETAIASGSRFYGELSRSREWIAAWRQERATASVLGGGRYTQPQHTQLRSYKRVSARTGKSETLIEEPNLYGLTVSPSRRFVYYWYSGSPYAPAEDIRRAVMDLETRVIFDLTAISQGILTQLAWAPATDTLLIAPNTNDTGGGNGLLVFDPRAAGADVNFEKGLILSVSDDTVEEGVSIDFRKALWSGDETIVYPQTRVGDGRTDWIAASLDGSQVSLTRRLPPGVDEPIARSSDSVHFLVDGKVVSVDRRGKTHSLTGSLPVFEVRFAPAAETALGNQSALPNIDQVLFSVNERKQAVLIDEAGKIQRSFPIPDDDVDIHHVSYQGLLYSKHGRSEPSRLVLSRTEGSSDIWTYNEHLSGLITTGAPIRLEYQGLDGEDLFGWLYLPAGSDPEDLDRHPLVTIAYAGDMWGETPPAKADDRPWEYWGVATTSMSLFTGAGYAVLFPSIPLKPKGEGRGDPMIDMMPSIHGALDAAIASGHVDEDRLALSGHSYGGYSAFSVAVQSDRFDAIIASASISNIASDFGEFSPFNRFQPLHGPKRASAAGMMGGEFGITGVGGLPPWVAEEAYVRNSPVFHAENVTTPILMFHGDLDWVPMTQSEEMFTALARQDKDVLFVRYWGEPHGAKRPKNHEDMLARTFRFLEDNGVTPGPRTAN